MATFVKSMYHFPRIGFAASLLLAGNIIGFGQNVVINEIMYHPSSENALEEYIELRNLAGTNVNLTGWTITKGVEFTFSTNTAIAAGGYLVVAAHVPTFAGKYPTVTNVVGGWIGLLSNSRNDIQLNNATGDRIDSVSYAQNGDWAVRQREVEGTFNGWNWFSPHDGLGKSLELINAAMPNEYGQNWGASVPTNGTPGRVNSLVNSDTPPFILEAMHLPVIPKSTEPVLVTARIHDEFTGSAAVRLHFRVDAAPTNAFSITNMFDDGMHGDGAIGDGIYGVTLPARPNGAVVEWYVRAEDNELQSRTWPGPALNTDGVTSLGQVANALYQVDDTVYTGTLPQYRLIMTAAENAVLLSIPGSSTQQGPNSQMNGTFISSDGTGMEVRYQCGFRNRGHGSRSQSSTRPNYHVNFPKDSAWKGVTAINLNSVNAHGQLLGAVMSQRAGLICADARAVRVRVNNTDKSPSESNGFYVANEAWSSDAAEHHFPNDSAGNIYRAIRDGGPLFDYRGADENSYRNTYFKQSNVSEDDWTDLINMLNVMGDGATVAYTEQNIRQVINVEQWLTFFAVQNIFANSETSPNVGYNDDYYMYAGVTDPRFMLIAYDQDSVLSIGSGSSGSGIFTATAANGMGAAMNRFMRDPAFEPIYYATLQRLLNTTFSPAQFNPVVQQTLGGLVGSSTITSITNWMNTRRSTIQGLINGLVPGDTNNPVATVSGEPRSPTPFNGATLTVGGAGIVSYRFRLNNGAFGAETPIATPIELGGLANGGTNVVAVIGRNATGAWQNQTNATVSRPWVVRFSTPAVRLNEVLAHNVAAVNLGGSFPDVIELFNEGGGSLNLAGLRLTDNPSDPDKFTFPDPTPLAGSAFLVLSSTMLGFTLDADGDGVYLFDRATNGNVLLDSVEFGKQLPDLSIGRFGSSGGWSLTQPTFGSNNVAQPTASPASLKINEWLAAGVSPIAYDFVEVFNTNTLPLDLGGLFLTDEPIGFPFRHRVAPLNFIAGRGFYPFVADGDAGNGPDHLNFKLSPDQGQIGLLNSLGVVLDCVNYGPQRTDVAQGRCPDGGASLVSLSLATPGSVNACPPVSSPAVTVRLIAITNAVKFNEIDNLDGINWTARDYNDAAWPAGPALLGVKVASHVLPETVVTPLTLGRMTYYFRIHFNVSPGVTFTSLEFQHVVDDGAAFYLNGNEIGTRFRLPPAPTALGYATTASSTTTASYQGPFAISATNLVSGDNVFAVEVHQNQINSADIIMGIVLDGLIVTNSATAAGLVINEVLANNASLKEADGTTPDWVELYNPSLGALDLSDMSLSDSTLNARRWVFPAGVILPAQSYLTIRCDSGVPASTNNGPILNTGFGLKANGDSVYLFRKLAEGGSVLDARTFGLQTPDYSVGRIPSGGSNWNLTLPTAGAANIAATLGNRFGLKINEWMATSPDDNDWFEIYNPDTVPVALGGLYLSDELNMLTKYPAIPALSFIGHGSNAFLRFEADEQTGSGPEHVGFKLSGGGDSIGLAFSGTAQIDTVSFGAQASGVSQGRLPDGTATIVSFPASASPRESNYLPLTNIVVNEALAHTDLPLEDAIELRNLTAASVNIDGWWLSDDREYLQKYRIPTNTSISANGFLVFYEYQFNPDAGLNQSFSLSSSKGDQVYLSQADGNGNLTGYRTSAKFGPSANGVSFGRFQTSVGVDFTAMSALSLGTAVTAQSPTNQITTFRTGGGAANPYPLVGPIVISEINYHPPDLIVGTNRLDNTGDEFIELHNVTGVTVPLYDPAHPTNGWRLRDAVDYDFTTSHSIPPGGYLILVSFDPAANSAALSSFQSKYGSNSILAGPFTGKLDNGSDSVELHKPDPPQTSGNDIGLAPYVLVERVHYTDKAPWPTNADGLGSSLQRANPLLYGNEPTNWVAAAPAPGPAVAGQLDTDHDGMTDVWEDQYMLDKNNPADAAQDADGDGMTNLAEFRAGTDPRSAGSVLKLVFGSFDGAEAALMFNAVAGKPYSVQFRDSFTAGSWTNLLSVPPQGVSQPLQVIDMSAGDSPQRFYRVTTPGP